MIGRWHQREDAAFFPGKALSLALFKRLFLYPLKELFSRSRAAQIRKCRFQIEPFPHHL